MESFCFGILRMFDLLKMFLSSSNVFVVLKYEIRLLTISSFRLLLPVCADQPCPFFRARCDSISKDNFLVCDLSDFHSAPLRDVFVLSVRISNSSSGWSTFPLFSLTNVSGPYLQTLLILTWLPFSKHLHFYLHSQLIFILTWLSFSKYLHIFSSFLCHPCLEFIPILIFSHLLQFSLSYPCIIVISPNCYQFNCDKRNLIFSFSWSSLSYSRGELGGLSPG